MRLGLDLSARAADARANRKPRLCRYCNRDGERPIADMSHLERLTAGRDTSKSEMTVIGSHGSSLCRSHRDKGVLERSAVRERVQNTPDLMGRW